MPVLMKTAEVMGRLGVSRGKLRVMVAAGALERVWFTNRRGKKIGYSWFRREEVEKVEKSCTTRTQGHEGMRG